jgi:hypothetical protein
MNSFFSTLTVIYPIIISIFFIIILFSVKLESSLETKITISFGFTDLTIPFVKSLWLIRFILIVVIIGFAIYPLFRDYSSFFPKNYKLTVSYSNDDIAKAISELSTEETEKYNIDKDWVNKKDQIWHTIILDISNKMNEKIDVKSVPMIAVGGNTYFSVKQAGFLRYDLEDSYGNLDHELQLPTGRVVRVFTRFLLERRERFNVELSDIYFRGGIIVSGRFKQFLYSQNELIYLFKVLALTKVKFIPSICIGKTIYLYQDTKMVPIGVAENSPVERE